jgi:hypothetical protein
MASMSIGYKELVSVSLLNDYQFGISSMTLESRSPSVVQASIFAKSRGLFDNSYRYRALLPVVTSESLCFLAAFLSFGKVKLPLSLHKVSITNDFKSYVTQAHVIQELKMSLKGFEIEI